MRWPFRRPRDAAPLREHTPRSGSPSALPTTADTRPGAAVDVVAPRAPASTPRSDWARLDPIAQTVQSSAPLTFHGDRFGRSVAGARPMAASQRHRTLRPDRAPSGLLLDAVQLESIEPTERRVETELPPVMPAAPSPAPIHRKAVDLGAPARRQLMASDAHVAFPDAPSRTQEPDDLAGMSISWTADGGFASQSSRMRMIGQRPIDAAVLDAPDATDEPGAPELRYLPAPGPRHERPPRDVVDIVEQATGVRIGDTVIDRSPEISDRASDMGAIAFTEAGIVHLPAELGDINELHNKAIVAHELTHVAQQHARRHVPSEDSPEGRELEAEAREMQRRFGAVRPHFMRRRPGSIEVAQGVQRLAHDEDPYAWQERGESPSQQSLLPAFGFAVAAGSTREARQQHEDEAWARDFEAHHAQHLNELRARRYHELKDEELRQKRITALREDEEAPTALDRRETIALRGQLDDEMPWQFGFPEHLTAAYPEPLPPEEEEQAGHEGEHHAGAHHDAGHDAGEPHATGHGATVAGAHAAIGARRLTTTHGTGGATHGRTPGGALGHGRGRTPGGHGAGGADEHDTQFDWQHRESTDREVVDAMFGGGLFGGLLGLAVGADTDATRRQAEENTPQLHERRQTKERELRHAALQTKRNEHLRNDDLDRAKPIKLSHAEVVQIREQLDQEMPLQYVTPQYLDQLEEAQITADGHVSRTDALEPDEPETGAGAGAGAQGRQATAPGGTPADSTATATAPGATDAAAAATADGTQDTGDGAAAGGGGGGRGGALRTGVAAAAGAVIGHQLAEHFDHGQHEGAHDDIHALDEEHAGRIFAAASEVDIDNLSRRLWSRIRREMRTELIVDRERAGSLADIR